MRHPLQHYSTHGERGQKCFHASFVIVVAKHFSRILNARFQSSFLTPFFFLYLAAARDISSFCQSQERRRLYVIAFCWGRLLVGDFFCDSQRKSSTIAVVLQIRTYVRRLLSFCWCLEFYVLLDKNETLDTISCSNKRRRITRHKIVRRSTLLLRHFSRSLFFLMWAFNAHWIAKSGKEDKAFCFTYPFKKVFLSFLAVLYSYDDDRKVCRTTWDHNFSF